MGSELPPLSAGAYKVDYVTCNLCRQIWKRPHRTLYFAKPASNCNAMVETDEAARPDSRGPFMVILGLPRTLLPIHSQKLECHSSNYGERPVYRVIVGLVGVCSVSRCFIF